MIDIAMIHVTNKPMEGEVFDVQDHARRTGTVGPVHMGRWLVQTSMELKSPSNGCWDPITGRDRIVLGWVFAPEKKKDVSSRTLWLSPAQRGWPTSGGTSPFDGLGRHLRATDVTFSVWQFDRAAGTCGRVWRPKEGQRFVIYDGFCPKKGQRLPQ